MENSRVAFVTGGGSGIGQETCISLAVRGVHVIVADVNEEAAEKTALHIREEGGRATSMYCNVASAESTESCFTEIDSRFERLDIFVGAAGIDLHKSFADTTLPEWDRVVGINLTGNFLCIKHAAPLMIRVGFGRIICIGSTSGIVGMGYPAYSATKSALLGLARSAAREYSRYGITANVICPGPTRTPLTDQLWTAQPGREDSVAARVPLGRVAQVSEIAAVISFVSSDDAGFVNGAEIVADGGLTSVWATSAAAGAR